MARSLKLAQQNLLMIGIALGFQLLFVFSLVMALSELEKQYERESHLRIVMGSLNGLLNQMLATAAAEGMFQATQNKPYRRLFLNGYNETLKQGEALKKMLAEDSVKDKNLNLLKDLIDDMHTAFEQGSKAMESGTFEDMVNSFKLARAMIEKAEVLSAATIRQMETENAENREKQRTGKIILVCVIVVGFLFNFIVFVLLLRYLDESNQRRFGVLASNINALSLQRPLRQRLEGEDEVARLDSLLHQVNENLQQARRKEQAMIENALDVICSLDRNLRFEQSNNACAKIFMIDKEDLLGKSLSSMVLPEDREKTLRELETVIANRSQASFENRIKLPDGTNKDIFWNVVYSPEEQNLFCVAHDISGRKEVERLKQEVIAVVSHDLRAPLTSIGLTLNILGEGGLGPVSDKAKNRISKAEASVSQLVSIINDLIDIEKYESGMISMDYKIYEGTELIEEAVGALEESARARGISIDCSRDMVRTTCDGQRIVRVLTNLLSNAIKFSPDNSSIKVSCQATTSGGAQGNARGVIFSVSDQGRGIAANKLSVIFERWKQVEKEDESKKGGSGLGLAICKALIDAHGGTIQATSELNRGSTFSFFLPENPPKPRA
ncbi:MAG: PAS domain-containing protein [Cyanobacteria bacterium SZAS LIN-3]|nr:PAS domain-containing protein [Cyanobacteria bacterium SZAS LIN-3]